MSAEPFRDNDIVEAVVKAAERSLLGAVAELERLERAPTRIELLDDIYLRFHALSGNAGVCGLSELSSFTRQVAQSIAELLTAALAVSRPQLRVVRQAIELTVALLDGAQVGPAFSRTRAAFLRKMADHCSLAAGEGETPPDGAKLDGLDMRCDPGQRAANNAPPDETFDEDAIDWSLGLDGDTGPAPRLRSRVELGDDEQVTAPDAVERLDEMTLSVHRLIGRLEQATSDGPDSRAMPPRELRQIAASLTALAEELEGLGHHLRQYSGDVESSGPH